MIDSSTATGHNDEWGIVWSLNVTPLAVRAPTEGRSASRTYELERAEIKNEPRRKFIS